MLIRLLQRYASTYRTTLAEILATNNCADIVAAVAPESIMFALAASGKCALMFFDPSVDIKSYVHHV